MNQSINLFDFIACQAHEGAEQTQNDPEWGSNIEMRCGTKII